MVSKYMTHINIHVCNFSISLLITPTSAKRFCVALAHNAFQSMLEFNSHLS